MKEFKTVVSRRIILLIWVTVIFACIVLLMGLFGYNSEGNASDLVKGLQTGIFLGTIAIIVVKIKKLRAALRNEAALKMMYIEERDERKQLIEQKANSLSLNVILLLTSMAAVVSGFFHLAISITLFAVLTVVAMVMVISKLYYNRKY